MGLYTKAELAKKPKPELLKLAEGHALDIDEDATVGDIRAALLEVDEEVEESDEEEVDEEEVEESDDEEEDDLELPEEDEVDEAPPAPAKGKAKAKQTKYTEGGKDGNGEALLGAKEVAAKVGTDAKSLRQFFRSGKSSFEAVGAGGRYEFKASDVDKIKTEFEAWKAGKPGRGRGAGSGGGSTRSRGRAVKEVEVIEEVEEIEELEDLEELDEDDLELEE